jgi:mycoredoxin
MAKSGIKFYGAEWCGDCHRAKTVFEQYSVDFDYINIDFDEDAANYVEKVNNGNRKVPTIVFPDESILVEPTAQELTKKLENI